MRFTIILLFTFIFTSSLSFADLEKKLNEQWRWTHFTTNDGLPSNNIRGIIVTPDGTVYAHSLKGISWYDGYKWNFIKGSEKISSEYNQHQFSLLSDSNYCIKYDKSIYIVCKHNIKNNIMFANNNNYNLLKIIPYASNRYLLLVNSKSLSNKYSLLIYTNNNEYNEVYSFINTEKEPILMQSNNGLVFLNNENGLYRIDADCKINNVIHSTNGQIDISPISFMPKSDSGYFLVGFPYEKRGLWELNKISNKIKFIGQYFPNYPDPIEFFNKNEGVAKFLGKNLYIWDGKKYNPFIHNNLYDINVNHLQINNDRLWLATTNGIYLFNNSSDIWKTYTYQSDLFVNSINKYNNNIYAGTSIGLMKIDNNMYNIDKTLPVITSSTNNKYLYYGNNNLYQIDTKNSITNIKLNKNIANIHKIYTDNKNHIWLLLLPKNSNLRGAGIFQYLNNSIVQSPELKSIENKRFYDMVQDKNGNYWFGGVEGLFKYDGNSIQQWNEKNGLKGYGVFTISIDSTGKVWVANKSAGIAYLSNDKFVYPKIFEKEEINNVWTLLTDQKNNLWIGTQTGLYWYKNKKLIKFDNSVGLSNSKVWPILVENDSVWIGTLGGGLNLLRIPSNYPKPKLEFKKPILNHYDAIIEWQVYTFFGIENRENIKVRYKVDQRAWSEWEKTKKINLYNLGVDEHIVQVEAMNMFGDVVNYQLKFNIEGKIYDSALFKYLIIIITSLIALFTIIFIIYRINLKSKKQQELYLQKLEHNQKEIISKNLIIEETNKALHEANEAKDRFYSILTHDIKSPLSAAQFGIDILIAQNNTLEEVKKIEILKKIRISTTNLFKFIDSFLSWNKYQQNLLSLNISEFSLKDLKEELSELYAILLEFKNIDLQFQFPDNDFIVISDKNLLLTILRNLISNAIKFSEENSIIVLNCKYQEDVITFYCQDFGKGIEEDKLNEIFTSNKSINSDDGHGFGLLFTKSMIEFLGGRLWCESKVNYGTTFFFEIYNKKKES